MPTSADKQTNCLLDSIPNSAKAVKRSWRRRLHLFCRLDFQCDGDQEEEERERKMRLYFSGMYIADHIKQD